MALHHQPIFLPARQFIKKNPSRRRDNFSLTILTGYTHIVALQVKHDDFEPWQLLNCWILEGASSNRGTKNCETENLTCTLNACCPPPPWLVTSPIPDSHRGCCCCWWMVMLRAVAELEQREATKNNTCPSSKPWHPSLRRSQKLWAWAASLPLPLLPEASHLSFPCHAHTKED